MARLAERLERPVQAGAVAVHAVEHHEPRQLKFGGCRPHLLGLDHDAGHGIHRDQRRVGHLQRGARIAQEVADPRRVDEVDLVLVPLGVGEAGRERVFAGDLFFVEVRHRRAVVDLAEAVDHPGIGEDGGDELRLPGSGVPDERGVPDGGGVVDLHGRIPPRISASYSRRYAAARPPIDPMNRGTGGWSGRLGDWGTVGLTIGEALFVVELRCQTALRVQLLPASARNPRSSGVAVDEADESGTGSWFFEPANWHPVETLSGWSRHPRSPIPQSPDPSILSSHSYLSASMGSRRDALTAGYMPKKMPTDAEKPSPSANDHQGSEMGNPEMRCTA